MRPLRQIFDIAKQTFTEWNEDGAPMLAAALAYYTAFSIAPLLIVVLGIVGLVTDQQSVQAEITAQIETTIGQDAAGVVSDLIDNTAKPGQGIVSSLLGLGALLLGALGVFNNLQTSLDRIWDVEHVEREGGIKGFVRDKLLSFGMLLVIGFLLLVSLILSAALSFVDGYLVGLLPGWSVLLRLISLVVSLGVTTVLFMFIFKFLPHIEIAWRDVALGAAVTAVLFTIGRTALGLYLGNTAPQSTYGAAGGFVLILLWVYYSAQILLLGAEFTQVYARRRSRPTVPQSYTEMTEATAVQSS